MKKFIVKAGKYIIRRAMREESYDIELALQRNALGSTVDYILSNMMDVDSVCSSFDLLSKSLSFAKLDGLVLEFGVFSGRSINHIAKQVDNVYGFDSFEGLPERWRDGFLKGCFALQKLPKVCPNVTLVKGWFDKTLPAFLQTHSEKIRFLHVDSDLYCSAKTIFDSCKERIVSGTVIVFDEYFNYPGWQNGEYKAFQEFISETGLHYRYLGYNRKHEQVSVIIC